MRLFLRLATLLLLLGNTSLVYAEPDTGDNGRHLKTNWQDGWYFLFGGGLTGSLYITDNLRNRGAAGPSIQTHLGYWAFDAIGFEIGSLVGFNYFRQVPLEGFGTRIEDIDYFSWNSAFYWGMRARLPGVKHTNNFNPYLRMMQGAAQSVGFFLNGFDRYPALRDLRIHNEGTMIGFAIGNVFNSLNSKRHVWYIEFGVHLFLLRQRFAISGEEVVPIIVNNEAVSKDDRIIQTSLSIGIAFF